MSGKSKKGQKKPSNQSANQTAAEQAELSETEESVSFRDGNEAINMAAGLQDFEVILTRRLKEQSESIHDMMLKYFKLYKDDIDEIKRSQAFVDAKFEKAKKATEDLTSENRRLRSEVDALKGQLKQCEIKLEEVENDSEALKQYLRRDMLEIHGVPTRPDEETDDLVCKLVELVDPELEISLADISISHRLPSREGRNAPPIIVKFCRRNVRDRLLSRKREIRSKTAMDLGFTEEFDLYINESLTQKNRELLAKVKEFKRVNHFKFAWTKNGKVLLRKDDNPASQVYSFMSMANFNEFKNSRQS